jgi:hypothetical protein
MARNPALRLVDWYLDVPAWLWQGIILCFPIMLYYSFRLSAWLLIAEWAAVLMTVITNMAMLVSEGVLMLCVVKAWLSDGVWANGWCESDIWLQNGVLMTVEEEHVAKNQDLYSLQSPFPLPIAMWWSSPVRSVQAQPAQWCTCAESVLRSEKVQFLVVYISRHSATGQLSNPECTLTAHCGFRHSVQPHDARRK